PLTKIIIRLLLVLFIIFILLFGIYSCVSLSLITKINYKETGERSRTPGAMSESYVESVLVIGTDGRSVDERGRSDSMILVSLNKKTNQIIMTSFLRDSYVNIPGYGMDKLNASYSYGGAELLMDTIESNFNVKIDNYILVNFTSFASIIDAAGGVDITLSDEEAEALNVILVSEVNGLMGDEPTADFLAGGGKVHLNGKQALCYSRIRNVGNNDFERTERQRTVMTQLIKKAASSGPSFISKVSKEALPNVTSNMTRAKLYTLSLRLPFVLTYKTKQLQIPYEGTFWGEDVTAGAVLAYDTEANIDIIEDTVFAE
ncbi:MAG: LCP family protein, partial [Ruminococcus sp.]|nr:LCP family protein [Ruminococcus sp.]